VSPARPFCSDISRENDEPLGATASRIDRWLLVEYRGLWSSDALAGSGLSDQVKGRLRELRSAHPRTRLLFIRRPDRRHHGRLRIYVADSREGKERLAQLEIARHEDLRDVDPWAEATPVTEPLFLPCTHGKHDPCCARYGRPLFDALNEQLEAEYVWQCTHVGGDRFAGNVVCPRHGLYFGRVAPTDAFPLLDEYLGGRVYLDRYRGRSLYPFTVQAAEVLLRREASLTGIDDLRLLGAERHGDGWLVRFTLPDGEAEVHVEGEDGELTYLTCHAEALRHPRRWKARVL
jgi:hypothetical protein